MPRNSRHAGSDIGLDDMSMSYDDLVEEVENQRRENAISHDARSFGVPKGVMILGIIFFLMGGFSLTVLKIGKTIDNSFWLDRGQKVLSWNKYTYDSIKFVGKDRYKRALIMDSYVYKFSVLNLKDEKGRVWNGTTLVYISIESITTESFDGRIHEEELESAYRESNEK